MTLYNALMLFWDNRFTILSVAVAFIVGYMVGCPNGLDIFFETGGDYNAKNENYSNQEY
jgi:hypothetical protein